MKTSSFFPATQRPACPMTLPSSTGVRIGKLGRGSCLVDGAAEVDDDAAEVDDDAAEVDDAAAEAVDGGKTMTNARVPFNGDWTILSR